MLARKFGYGHFIQSDKCHQMLLLVAEHDSLRDEGYRLDHCLDTLRRDVLSCRVDDQIFLSVGNAQVTVLVERADVAGPEPTVFEGFLRRFFIFEVA